MTHGDDNGKPNYHTGGILLFLWFISLQLSGIIFLLGTIAAKMGAFK